MRSRYIRFASVCTLCVLLCLFALSGRAEQTSRLVVTLYQVGHGDMIGILTPAGETTLIDCGDSASALARKRIRDDLPPIITRFIATHAHDDHIGNFPLILPRTRLLYDSGLEYPSRAQDILYRAAALGRSLDILTRGTSLDLGSGVQLKVLWPPCPLLRGTASDANNNSLVMMLIFRNFRMLLTADIENEAIMELMETSPNLQCTAVKIPHHGSRGSLHPGFTRSLRARWAIASCGQDGDPAGHGLPHEDCLRAWRQAGMEVHVTGREGSIRIESDGHTHTLHVLP